MDRREFTLESALAVLGAAVVTISGCGGGGSPAASTPPPATGGSPNPSADKLGGISDNHGHVAMITSAQLVAANAISLDIRGSADHTHVLTLTANDVTNIGGGTRLQRECTSGTGHIHTVTFNPTDPTDPSRY
jgi:hypothetical protein